MTSEPLPPAASEESALARYHSVSSLAIVALLLALLSALALVHPLLWIVPVLAVVTALLALRRITLGDEVLVGRGLAVCALLLALFLAGCASARFFTVRAAIYQEAQAVATSWLNTLRQGDLDLAHQWTLTPGVRQRDRSQLGAHYAQDLELRAGRRQFFSREPARTLAAAGNNGEVRFTGNVEQAGDREVRLVVLQYELVPHRAGQEQKVPLRIVLRRTTSSGDGPSYWQVVDVVDPDSEVDRLESDYFP